MTYVVKTTSKIWKKESGSLFDYETDEIFVSHAEIKQSSVIFRKGTNIVLHKSNHRSRDDSYLFTLKQKSTRDNFTLEIDQQLYNKNNIDHKISENWIILKFNFDQSVGYKVKQSDIIKFGKMVFRVKEIGRNNKFRDVIKNIAEKLKPPESEDNNNLFLENAHNQVVNDNPSEVDISDNTNMVTLTTSNFRTNNHLFDNATVSNTEYLDNTTFINIQKKQKSFLPTESKVVIDDDSNENNNTKSHLCRVCFCDGTDEILISICNCIGSVKFIHFNCLKKWFLAKIKVKAQNFVVSFSYPNFKCEICQANIPEIIQIRDFVFNFYDTSTIFDIVAEKNPIDAEMYKNSKFMTLESLNESSGEDGLNNFYVICMKSQNVLRVGRANEADVRITDITVSRNHCDLISRDDGLYLVDLPNSKFGTHVNLPLSREVPLLLTTPLFLQCGRNFVELKMTKTCLGYFLCVRKNHIFYNSYTTFFDLLFENTQKVDIKIAELDEDNIEIYKKMKTQHSIIKHRSKSPNFHAKHKDFDCENFKTFRTMRQINAKEQKKNYKKIKTQNSEKNVIKMSDIQKEKNLSKNKRNSTNSVHESKSSRVLTIINKQEKSSDNVFDASSNQNLFSENK